jgi:hypothetical protein
VFFIIAALFLGIGVMLLLATWQRRPKAADDPQPSRAAEEPQRPAIPEQPKPAKARGDKAPRHKAQRPRRGRDGESEPPRITKEEYLRQLAERSGAQTSEQQQPPSERQPL